jgi:hypothetical protein
MIDTSPEMVARVADRHAAMTPAERMRAACALFETARAIVESSLPAGLTNHERRLAYLRRIHGESLPGAAEEAFARYSSSSP